MQYNLHIGWQYQNKEKYYTYSRVLYINYILIESLICNRKDKIKMAISEE